MYDLIDAQPVPLATIATILDGLGHANRGTLNTSRSLKLYTRLSLFSSDD